MLKTNTKGLRAFKMKSQKSNVSNLMIELCEISLIVDQRDFKLSCLRC